MGVLDDIGILNNQQLSKSAFSGFIVDVKKRLKTGAGIFKSPTVGAPADPIENFDLATIENQFLFPEFHRIWKERYTKTVQQLNLPSAHQAVPKIPLAPLIDPTALARALGVKNQKPAKFPDILYEISGLPTPSSPAIPATIKDVITNNQVKTIEFFHDYLSGIQPSPKVITKIIDVVNKPPGKIIPQHPDPRTLKLGYTEQYNFEKAIYSAQRKAHAALMVRAADPAFLPSLIAQMMSGQNDLLLTEVYAIVSSFQPTPMSTSVFEIAAQEILMQHQVKMQCLALLAQNIGSGQIVSALAATPEEQGGLGLIDMSKSKSDQTSGEEKTQPAPGAAGGSTSTSSSSTLSGDPVTSGGGSSQSPFAPMGQPVADEPPPGVSGTGGPTSPSYGDGYNMGGPPADEYPPAGASSGGPSQQPSGFGFGGPEQDVPPGGDQGQGSLASGPQGSGGPSGQQGSPFGFEAPPNDVPPPGAQGGGGNSQTNVSPWDIPPDNYPSEQGSGQAAPPGWGGAPPDEGSPPYGPPPLPKDEPEKGETMGPGHPTEAQADPEVEIDDPPNIKSSDIHPENAPQNSGNSPGSDDEGDDDTPQQGKKSKKSGFSGTKVAKRTKDLLEGGSTCPAQSPFRGGCLGPPPDFEKTPTINGNIPGTFRGYQGGSSDPEWANQIPGGSGVIGGGYTSKEQIAAVYANANPNNPVQAVATSCGQLAGWLLANLIYPQGTTTNKYIFVPVTSELKERARLSGYGYWDLKSSAAQLGRGFDSAWVAAALGAFVCTDPKSILRNGHPNAPAEASAVDPQKRIPKYGSVFILRDGDFFVRHAGIIIDFRPSEGWMARADAGQGSMGSLSVSQDSATQGMAYSKTKLHVGQPNPHQGTIGGEWLIGGEAAQNDANHLRVIQGYIDVDMFVKNFYNYAANNGSLMDKWQQSGGPPEWTK